MCMRVILLLCFFLGIRSVTSMPSFADFMKDIDWDAAIKNAEEMMKKNPELFGNIANMVPPPSKVPALSSTSKKVAAPSRKPAPAKPEAPLVQSKTDPRSLFLDPLSDKEKVDPNIHIDIPKNKLESFAFHRLLFMLELKKLELIIEQSPFFSIECTEKLKSQKSGIDAIFIDLESIASRSFYIRIFFSKENGKLRQSMIAALDQLRALNTSIFSSTENKKIFSTAVEDIHLLKTRAQETLEEPLKYLDTDLPHTQQQKQFHRGKKLLRSKK